MSQPFDRKAKLSAPGKVDNKLGEFWVENPWDIHSEGFNLSSFERTRIYINRRGKAFLDISHLTGADTDGDGRCVVAADFRNNGRQEVVVRQIGGDHKQGGAVFMLYENNFPQRHYLNVSLRGKKSNRLGIGARLVATVKGQNIVREMNPINSFRSQMPSIVHFGLGKNAIVDQLTIQWPSGKKQVLKNFKADRHIVVDEDRDGAAAIETVVPGRIIRP